MRILDRKYLNLIKEQTIAEFKLKEQDSILGYAWTLLHPIFTFIILYSVFSRWAGQHMENFAAYLLVGIVQWNFFSEATSTSLSILVRRSNLIRNVNFDRKSLVISSILTIFLSHLIELLILLILLFILGKLIISLSFLFLPIVLIIQLLLVVGVSLLISISYVQFRDIERIWRILVMLGFFITPVFYSISILPEYMQKVVTFNPLTHILTATRTILLYGGIPSLSNLYITFLFCLTIFSLAYLMFKKIEPYISEVI